MRYNYFLFGLENKINKQITINKFKKKQPTAQNEEKKY